MNDFFRTKIVADNINDFPVEILLFYKPFKNKSNRYIIDWDFTIELYEGDFGLLSITNLYEKVRIYITTHEKGLIGLYNNRKVLSEK